MAIGSMAQRSPLKRSLERTFGSLRHRNFRLLWTGNIATQAGYWMFSVAQGWLVLELTSTNPALWLGAVAFAGGIPLLLFPLIGGVVADRFDRKKLLLIYQAVSTVYITVFAVLVTFKLVEIWHVLVIAFLFGTTMALNIPLRQALVPGLVGKDDLMNATALNSVGFNAMRVVGPAAAGVFIATIGTVGVFWLMVVFYVWAMLWVVQMELPAREPAKDKANPLQGLTAGLRFMRHRPDLISLMLAISVPTLLVLPYLYLFPLYAKNILLVGATGLGMMEGSVGFGALVAALVVAGMGIFRNKGRIMIGVIVAYSLMVSLFALSPFFPLSLLLLALSGIAWSALNALNSTLIQMASPDEYRGRIFAVYTLTFSLQSIGNLVIGPLADAFGAPIVIASAGLLAALLSIALAWYNPRMRNMD
jgi:MFS family permease